MNMPDQGKNARVRVCVNVNCRQRGSERIYDELSKKLDSGISVEKTPDCFRFCKIGPNVSVNGAVLHHMRLSDAAGRVRREIDRPGKKQDGVGTKSLDELDDVLESFFA